MYSIFLLYYVSKICPVLLNQAVEPEINIQEHAVLMITFCYLQNGCHLRLIWTAALIRI